MRSIGRIALFCLVVVAVLSPVLMSGIVVKADGGAPYDPGDGRINPLSDDRVTVWCNANNIDVWGLDVLGNGHRLATFLPHDVIGAGVNGLTKNLADWGTVSISVDSTQQNYVVTWTGGPYGADGSLPFIKTFSCAFSG